MDWKYGMNNKRIELPTPPKARKKITATRLAGILGLNEWTTPFQMWCEITKVAQPKFEDNQYTLAGKAIEPKLIQYVRDNMFDLDPENILDPKQYYGNIYESVKYDFFKDTKVFGGMWDAVYINDKKIDCIIECKTSSRPQDWINGVPTYYLIQGLMYAYLTGAYVVIFPVAFLKDEDYAHPENFVCTEKNTKLYQVTVSQQIEWKNELYTIADLMGIAMEWYKAYVDSGISPEFDEEKDEEYLKILRLNKPSEDLTLDAMTTRALQIQARIEELTRANGIDDLEKELKNLKESIKQQLMNKLSPTDKNVLYGRFNLFKTIKNKLDEQKLKDDGIYDKYLTQTETYTLTIKKEDK